MGRHSYEPGYEPRRCPNEEWGDCDRAYDQEEGRYCPSCEDMEATCANDHCMECGNRT